MDAPLNPFGFSILRLARRLLLASVEEAMLKIRRNANGDVVLTLSGRLKAENVSELQGFDFVFIAVDDGPSRDLITRALETYGVAFVDVGLGVNDIDDRLSATARVSAGTTSRPVDRVRLPVHPAGPENDYRHNIQIAELNAVNATLAVIKWKKIAGIYADLEHEHFSTYATSMNAIVNADHDVPR